MLYKKILCLEKKNNGKLGQIAVKFKAVAVGLNNIKERLSTILNKTKV